MGGSYQRQTVFSVSAMCRVFRETTPKQEENARGPRVYSPPNLARAKRRRTHETRFIRYKIFAEFLPRFHDRKTKLDLAQRISSNDPDFLQSRFAVSLKKLAAFVYPLCV